VARAAERKRCAGGSSRSRAGRASARARNLAFVASCSRPPGSRWSSTREPGGTPLAERVRDVIVSPSGETMPPMTELLLIFAARAAAHRGMHPPRARGRTLGAVRPVHGCQLCLPGRGARPWGGAGALARNSRCRGELRPDLTLLLDADPAIGLARANARGAADRFEQERVAFFRRVRAGYLARAAAEPGRFRIIDASQSLEKVQSDIRIHINKFLQDYGNA
jgi:dTMP kinase